MRQGSGLNARAPVPLSSSLFSPPLRDAEEDKIEEEEEDDDNERGEEPALSERGLAAVFASPPLVGQTGPMRPVSQTAAPGGGGKGTGIQPTPALPPLSPPARATLSKERGPVTESEGEDGEEKESAASGADRKRARPAEAEEKGDQEGAAAAGVQSKKRRRSLGDALGGWISSLFASASKSGQGASE